MNEIVTSEHIGNNIDEYLNKIINGDCIEVMKKMPDKCVDLCLTDFPYGVGYEYNEYEDTKENLTELIREAMPEILRISKRALITCGVKNIWRYPEYEWCMAWMNLAGAGYNPWGFTTWQPVLCYGKDPYLANRMGPRATTIVHCESAHKDRFKHSCPKPINFWKKILLRGSVFIDDIIFDPLLGSGTTAVAAISLGRRYIGIEMSSEYCDLAQRRAVSTTPALPFVYTKEEEIEQANLFQF